jgi:eukaryotic-like serine/threonine-protein kinase
MEDIRIGQVVDGRYRLVDRLAAGGMGVVYRAERVGLSKPVAIKFLHRSEAFVADSRQRFEREAAAMSRLSHPNLASIIDYGAFESVPYLVMEFHPGESLRQAIDKGAMTGQRAVFIARQMLAGLGNAHASGVVHRDLKPENVLLVGAAGEDLVKILDFGVAKLLEGDGAPSELSVVAGAMLGTPAYMSPEQVRSEPVDARADVYAVGLLLYEMVTGQRPFGEAKGMAVLRQHLESAPIPPRTLAPGISPALQNAIVKALEKDRDQRWRSADEFSRALLRTPEGRASTVAPTRRATTVGIDSVVAEMPQRQASIWWFIAALALAVVGAGWLVVATGAVDVARIREALGIPAE